MSSPEGVAATVSPKPFLEIPQTFYPFFRSNPKIFSFISEKLTLYNFNASMITLTASVARGQFS